MKKLVFLLTVAMVLTLTGCKDKPFESDLDDYTFIETDSIIYEFDDGTGVQEIFRYTFDVELKMFVNEAGTIYNFKNINNYQETSDQIEQLLETYQDTIQYKTFEETGFGDSIDLSLGATEEDYNLEKVEIGDIVYSENAFISTESGVTLMVAYNRFIVDGENLYVPSYFQMFLNTIHQEVSWEFLPENNEFSDDKMKKITYELIIVPLPMKTGAFSSYDELLESGIKVDDFTRVVNTTSNETGTWYACTDEQTEQCISPISTIIEVQIHEMFEDDVFLFYEENFGAILQDEEFTFFHNGNAFVLYDTEEVKVRLDNDEITDVVNGKIRLK